MPPEPQDTFQKPSRWKRLFNFENPDLLYDFWDRRVKWCKIVLQMLTGIGTFGYVGYILITQLWPISSLDHVRQVADATLGGAGVGLAIAAAIELAYALFTNGPDEAINPLL